MQTTWAHRRGRRACRLRAALVEPVIDFTHHREAWDDWPDDAEDEPSVGDEGFDEDVEPAEEAFGPQVGSAEWRARVSREGSPEGQRRI